MHDFERKHHSATKFSNFFENRKSTRCSQNINTKINTIKFLSNTIKFLVEISLAFLTQEGSSWMFIDWFICLFVCLTANERPTDVLAHVFLLVCQYFWTLCLAELGGNLCIKSTEFHFKKMSKAWMPWLWTQNSERGQMLHTSNRKPQSSQYEKWNGITKISDVCTHAPHIRTRAHTHTHTHTHTHAHTHEPHRSTHTHTHTHAQTHTNKHTRVHTRTHTDTPCDWLRVILVRELTPKAKKEHTSSLLR